MGNAPKNAKSKSGLCLGFQHIREKGPRTALENAINEWTEIEIADADSPVFGWSAGLVKDSIRNYHASAMVATKTRYFPLHLRNIAGWFIDDVLFPYDL
jgi:hypothetical protein